MAEELLHTCGLNHNEQQVLLALLRSGGVPAASLAKRVGLKRTNVYAILESLSETGLISKRQRQGVTWFSAVNPERISSILEARARQKYESVRNATQMLQPTLTEISASSPRHLAGFELSTVESQEGVAALLEELLLAGHFSAIFNPQIHFVPEIKPKVLNCLIKSAETAPPIREIAVSGPITDWYASEIRNKNHQLKQIPAGKHILSDMILQDGAVTLLHYDARQEVAFRIAHEDYYESMMCIFEMLWDSL